MDGFETLWRWYQFVFNSPMLLNKSSFPIIPNYWNILKTKREAVTKKLCEQIGKIDYEIINVKNVQRLEKTFKSRLDKSIRQKLKNQESWEPI